MAPNLSPRLVLTYMYMYMSWVESHPRQLIFLRKSDCLGCAVLLCLVCLTLHACFFHHSFSSLIKTCILSTEIKYDKLPSLPTPCEVPNLVSCLLIYDCPKASTVTQTDRTTHTRIINTAKFCLSWRLQHVHVYTCTCTCVLHLMPRFTPTH